MEYYTEYMVSRKKSAMDYALILAAIFVALMITFVLGVFLTVQLYGMIAFLLIAAAWYGAYYFVTSRNIEFEYCFVNGDLDIDQITARKKRKQLISVKLKNAEILAPVTEKYQHQYKNDSVQQTVDASMGDKSILDFFVIYNQTDGKKTKVIFTPNQKMLEMMQQKFPQIINLD